MNKRYIIGTITIIGITGLTIYAIKKSRDLKNAHENVFDINDAYEHVKYAEQDVEATQGFYQAMKEFEEDIDAALPIHESDMEPKSDGKEISDDEMYELKDRAHEDASDGVNWNASFGLNYDGTPMTKDEINKMNSNEEEFIEDIDPSDQIFVTYQEPKINYEELDKLRHKPNSPEALQQFIHMELADWREPDETFKTMANLYKTEFVPRNDGDHILKTKLIDYRIGFFGFNSIHATEISMADIILHYARAAAYNIGETTGFWVEYFLGFNELHHETDDLELEDSILELNQHAYFNTQRQTHGLFGLTTERFNEAERIASFSVHGEVTYEAEFNEFLKACL